MKKKLYTMNSNISAAPFNPIIDECYLNTPCSLFK